MIYAKFQSRTQGPRRTEPLNTATLGTKLAKFLNQQQIMYCLINEQECFIRFKATSGFIDP